MNRKLGWTASSFVVFIHNDYSRTLSQSYKKVNQLKVDTLSFFDVFTITQGLKVEKIVLLYNTTLQPHLFEA